MAKEYAISYTLLTIITCEEDEIDNIVKEQSEEIEDALISIDVNLNDVEYNELK